MSPGFRLPAKWIIHTVGPVWRGGNQREPQRLEAAYRSSFEQARALKVRSIAFPAISTGVFGYPKPAAARIALKVMHEFEDAMGRIVVCCFSAEDEKICREAARDT